MAGSRVVESSAQRSHIRRAQDALPHHVSLFKEMPADTLAQINEEMRQF